MYDKRERPVTCYFFSRSSLKTSFLAKDLLLAFHSPLPPTPDAMRFSNPSFKQQTTGNELAVRTCPSSGASG